MQTAIFMCLVLGFPIHAAFGNVLQLRPAEAACNEFQKESHVITAGSLDFSKAMEITTRSEELPFLVSFLFFDDSKNRLEYTCAGSLITTKHVLTSGKCVTVPYVPIQATLGEGPLRGISNNVQNRSIAKITKHPKYKSNNQYYNIAIVELSTPVVVTKYVKPICLQYNIPQLSLTESSDRPRFTASWTTLQGNQKKRFRGLFMSGNLKFVERSACNARFISRHLGFDIDDSMICSQASNNFCPNIGSPLIQKTNQFVSLIGVSSFHLFCGFNEPNVYQNVYYHLDWIEEVVWPEKKEILTQFENQQSDFIFPSD